MSGPIAFRPSPRARVRPPRAGFALLITLTLLAFVVLLLVGLASYTKIETAVAGNFQKQAQARQNALLALDVALGQLQKNAGPDQRVTATAESFGGINGTKYYTGVWNTATPGTSPVWLASGLETGSVSVTAAPALAQRAELIGVNTAGTGNADSVVARLMPITTVGVPGQSGTVVIGNYAWWVGDQGVKASVGLGDRSSSVNFPPWTDGTSTDLRDRIRQQISLGAGAADATGAAIFEPRTAANSALAANTLATSQLAFFNAGTTTTAKVGATAVAQNYHAWSANNYGVLSDTNGTGLRRDLSLDPSLLGAAAQAWLDYPSYMESPDAAASLAAAPNPPTPLPNYPTINSLRRRYRVTPPISDAGGVHSVSPILSFFGICFSVRESSSAPPQMEVAARCVIGLWNPYSAALIPEDLQIEITRLPTILVTDSAGGATALPLQDVMSGGGPLLFDLPKFPANGTRSDYSSWLPGRVYDWAAVGNTSASQPTAGYPMIVHFPDAIPPGGAQGIVRATTAVHSIGGASPLTRSCSSPLPTTLRLRLLRASDGAELAAYDSITFPSFGPTSPIPIANKFVDFAFVFRLPQTDELPAGGSGKWLSSLGRDPRAPNFPAKNSGSSGFIGGAQGDDPGAWGGDNITSFTVSSPDRLLDRSGANFTYNEDVPVFELPRAPLLSIGALQHLGIDGAQPFAIGNSWGASTILNGVPTTQLFDQFFFSGLTNSVAPTGSGAALVLPNPLLRVISRTADGSATSVTDLRSALSARTSKFLLQAGSFNVNSVSVAAWRATLRSVRFDAPFAFNYLNADANTGSAAAAGETRTTRTSSDAQFFRFSQSAQETYEADPGLAAGATIPSTANTHLFRRGMITLSAAQVDTLATRIVALIQARAATHGPFLSLAEFLGPAPEYVDAAGQQISLLEKAIADAGINAAVPEFSSQWLTQGDIMTALAPVLFPRSDTFVIRTYGEAVNPATGLAEGRAWCEATVQRVPDYVDPVDDATVPPALLTSPLNQNHGRRFKVVSFRWLTRSDI